MYSEKFTISEVISTLKEEVYRFTENFGVLPNALLVSEQTHRVMKGDVSYLPPYFMGYIVFSYITAPVNKILIDPCVINKRVERCENGISITTNP